jgi:hypothetical protein
MKIVYIAKHNSGGNDDEGSIDYALNFLGHEVIKIKEQNSNYNCPKCDFVLFHHHWTSLRFIRAIKQPKVFWGFDLVEHDEVPQRPTSHFKKIAKIADIGFCSDGAWASKHSHFHWLTQGADSRIIGQQKQQEKHKILFTGSLSYCPKRLAHYRLISERYPTAFFTLTSSAKWVYRERLAQLIGASGICVALQSPIKENYWSNRVYVVGGFGGFFIHPYTSQLIKHYKENEEIILYHSLDDFFDKVDFYLNKPQERERISSRFLKRTKQEHTYIHRCQILLQTVKNNLL